MKSEVSGTQASLRAGWLTLAAGSTLAVLAALVTVSNAAPFARGIPGPAPTVPPSAMTAFTSSVTYGPGVIVPAVPTPRSPFQPPVWVSSQPPWLR